MPCCTYLDDARVERYREFTRQHLDADEQKTLAHLMASTGQEILIASAWDHPPKRRLFGLLPPIKQDPIVEVLVHISGPEWQMINFVPRFGLDWSINTVVPLTEARSWIWGVGVGMDAQPPTADGRSE